MILYRLSFFKYTKEKVKETLGLSGRCKGDIFLNPALKAGRDILREGQHDDHIIHAIRYFAQKEGYGAHYVDLNAGFGAIACEVASSFMEYGLYEADPLLRGVLKANMTLKGRMGAWDILSTPLYPTGKIIVRCETLKDLEKLLTNEQAMIIFQNKKEGKLPPVRHDVYHYTADMDKHHPFKTLWALLSKGYAFQLRKWQGKEALKAGDYIFLPKGMI